MACIRQIASSLALPIALLFAAVTSVSAQSGSSSAAYDTTLARTLFESAAALRRVDPDSSAQAALGAYDHLRGGPPSALRVSVARLASTALANTQAADSLIRVYGERSIADADALAVPAVRARAYVSWGSVLAWIGTPEEAAGYALEARRLFEGLHDDDGSAEALAILLALVALAALAYLARQLRRRNRERETLVHEVHHRVKNNLQVLSSLLYLQRRHVTDPAAISAIQASQNRVEAMGLVHQRLYTRDRLTEVRMDGYLAELAETLRDAYGRDEVELQYEVAPVDLPVQTAIEIGLIANELISNALKYAFAKTGQDPTIAVSLQAIERGGYRFEVADNGGGVGAHEEAHATSTGFGSRLLTLLTEKLEAELHTEHDDRGYRAWFEFG